MPSELNETAPRVRVPRRVRERQMIEVATSVFGRHGYYTASMDQIAEEAGISKPMLYAYFQSKEGLYAACMRRAGDELIEAVQNSYDAGRTTEQRLWDGFLAYFTFVGERSDAWRLIAFDAFPAIEQFRDIALDAQEALRGLVEELVRLASAETPVDPFADPARRAALARAMFGAAESLAFGWLEGEDRTPEIPCRDVMSFFWTGLGRLVTGETWDDSAVAKSASPPAADE